MCSVNFPQQQGHWSWKNKLLLSFLSFQCIGHRKQNSIHLRGTGVEEENSEIDIWKHGHIKPELKVWLDTTRTDPLKYLHGGLQADGSNTQPMQSWHFLSDLASHYEMKPKYSKEIKRSFSIYLFAPFQFWDVSLFIFIFSFSLPFFVSILFTSESVLCYIHCLFPQF